MPRKPYNIIVGKDITTINQKKKEPLVEGIIYPNNYILLVAEEKVGKTLLSQNLTCSCSRGTPFLNTFEIPHPIKTWYMPTEVREEQLKERFIRIGGRLGIDNKNICLIPTFFKYNTELGRQSLDEIIKLAPFKPDLIIIDALYKAVKGSIRNDDVVAEFHDQMDYLMRELNCAILVVHHLTKPTRNNDNGNYYNRSDKDVFGSAYLTAGVDHVFRLEKCNKNPKDLILKCDTQRSGDIVDTLRLKLDDYSLTYEIVTVALETENDILDLLRKHPEGLDVMDIKKKLKKSKSTISPLLTKLCDEGKIEKFGTKPVLHRLTQKGAETEESS